MRHASLSIIRTIENFEGFIPSPRNIGDGVLTVGYGETQGLSGPYPWTHRRAERRLKRRVRKDYEPYIHRLGIPLGQNEFDAILSAIYNLGPGVLDKGRSLGDALRTNPHKGDYAGRVRKALLLYVDPGTQFEAGLTRRRQAEADLFAKPDGPNVKAINARRHKLQARAAKIRLSITSEKKRLARINRTINRLNKRLQK